MSKFNSGKKQHRKISSGPKNSKPRIFILGFLLILVGIFGVVYNPFNSTEEDAAWQVSESGILSFAERGEPVFTIQEIEDTYAPENPDTLKVVSFDSKRSKVQALLRIPLNSSVSTRSPGLLLLPGAGVTKEGEQGLAVELSKMGYATLTLDQRNLARISMERDFELFKANLEPLQYAMVYDALKAADVLAVQPEVDKEKLAILGESNGGRFAILACALNPDFKGVIGISTAGYGGAKTSSSNDNDADGSSMDNSETVRFKSSVDPDFYLSSLPPAKLVLVHSFNNTIIPHEMAVNTYKLAKEPKVMYNLP